MLAPIQRHSEVSPLANFPIYQYGVPLYDLLHCRKIGNYAAHFLPDLTELSRGLSCSRFSVDELCCVSSFGTRIGLGTTTALSCCEDGTEFALSWLAG